MSLIRKTEDLQNYTYFPNPPPFNNPNHLEQHVDKLFAIITTVPSLSSFAVSNIIAAYVNVLSNNIEQTTNVIKKIDRALNHIGDEMNQLTEIVEREMRSAVKETRVRINKLNILILGVINDAQAQLNKLDRAMYRIGQEASNVILLVLSTVAAVAKTALKEVGQCLRKIHPKNLKHLMKRMKKPEVQEGIEMSPIPANMA